MPMRVTEYTMLKYLNLYDNNICYPIIDLVIYYGTSKWNNEWCSLSSIYNPPKEFKEFFIDVNMNLVQTMEQDYSVFNHPDVAGFFEGFQRIQKWNGEPSELVDMELSTSTILALGVVTDSKILIEIANKQKEGRINMCEAIDNALRKREEISEARGIGIGRNEGIEIGEKRGELKGELKRQIKILKKLLQKKFHQLSPKIIERIEKCSMEQLELITDHIFDIDDENFY